MKHKKSRFVYETMYNGKCIYYHSLNDYFIILNSVEEQKKFNILMKEPLKLQKEMPGFFKSLKNNGFIIEDGIDELDEIRLKNKLAVFSDKNYWLTINPTLNCNLNCWYCDQSTFSKQAMNSDTVKNIKNHLLLMIKNNYISGLHLDWFGGEPLLYFDEVVYPISVYANELKSEYNLFSFINHATTNATCINVEMCKKFNEINLRSFQITVDGSEEKHNKVKNINGKPTYKTVVNNINYILDFISHSSVTLRINFEDFTLIDAEALFNEFPKDKRSRIKIDFQRVWQTTKTKFEKNEKLLDLLYLTHDLGYNVQYTPLSPRYFHTCYCDRFYHLNINYDGSLYKCPGDITPGKSKKNKVGVLNSEGNIIWNNNLLNKRVAKATFENKNCLNCKFLSFCYGPCSKKQDLFTSNKVPFKSICYKYSHEISLDDYLVFLAYKKGLIEN